jgi:BirA family biotin operon repressor/biotin-[acetyl-CoA-carboxylase] ligase
MTEYLDAKKLKSAVTGRGDLDVVVHQQIDSTNSWSLRQCRQGRPLPFACFAEKQTQGRGRRGKRWLSSAHSNIVMSLAWSFALPAQQLQLLPISVAVAILNTLERLQLQHVKIKWPNDVYVQEKKIAGILIETRPVNNSATADIEYVQIDAGDTAIVIGVGLNYDMSSYELSPEGDAEEVLPDLTDIRQQMLLQGIDSMVNRTEVASILLRELVGMAQEFRRDPKSALHRFRAGYDYCKDKRVEVVLDNAETLSGIATGVNSAAELIVDVDGREMVFNSAEVSVRADSV